MCQQDKHKTKSLGPTLISSPTILASGAWARDTSVLTSGRASWCFSVEEAGEHRAW